jgi:hypothetical protein
MLVSSVHSLNHIQIGCYSVALRVMVGVARASSERVLYSSNGYNHGDGSGLKSVGGVLYGTTFGGRSNGDETLFSAATAF